MPNHSICAITLVVPALAGCGAVYPPRPSPRLAVVAEGASFTILKNGKAHPVGFLGGDLDEVVRGNPRAEEEVSTFQKKSIAGFTFGILGSVATGAGAAVVVGNELSRSPTDTPRIAGLSLAIGGVVFALVGSMIQASAQKHMWNAINMYNDDLPPPWGFGASSRGAALPYGAPPSPAPAPFAPGYAPYPAPAPPLPSAPPPTLPR